MSDKALEARVATLEAALAHEKARGHALTVILGVVTSHHEDRAALRRALAQKHLDFLASAAEEEAEGKSASAAHERAVAMLIGVFDNSVA